MKREMEDCVYYKGKSSKLSVFARCVVRRESSVEVFFQLRQSARGRSNLAISNAASIVR